MASAGFLLISTYSDLVVLNCDIATPTNPRLILLNLELENHICINYLPTKFLGDRANSWLNIVELT